VRPEELTFDADIVMDTSLVHKDAIVTEQWREERRKGIGGADAAASMNLSPYATQVSLYLDKVDPRPDEDKPIYEAGRRMEPVIAQWFADHTGYEVIHYPVMLRARRHPFMLVNVDRFVVNGAGELGVLECKNVDRSMAHEWRDGPPIHARLQALHGLSVCGDAWRKMYVAACIGGNEYRYFEIERDDELLASLITGEEAFWTAVQLERMPDVDGSDVTRKALRDRFEAQEGSTIDVDAEFVDLLRRRAFQKQAMKIEEQRLNEIESRMLVLMGGAEIARFEGDVIARYKTVKKDSYTVKAQEYRQWSIPKTKERDDNG